MGKKKTPTIPTILPNKHTFSPFTAIPLHSVTLHLHSLLSLSSITHTVRTFPSYHIHSHIPDPSLCNTPQRHPKHLPLFITPPHSNNYTPSATPSTTFLVQQWAKRLQLLLYSSGPHSNSFSCTRVGHSPLVQPWATFQLFLYSSRQQLNKFSCTAVDQTSTTSVQQ